MNGTPEASAVSHDGNYLHPQHNKSPQTRPEHWPNARTVDPVQTAI